MLAVEVNFLTGRFVATAYHDRKKVEWPPHPARFFSALVATWADADDPDRSERGALEWLEARSPPSIRASEAVPRGASSPFEPAVVSHFVPVNDTTVISRSSYVSRYKRIAALEDQIKHLDPADPAERIQLIRFETRLRAQKAVSALVSHAGPANPNTAMELFPECRTRQERHFPSVTPIEPRVIYMWDVDPPRDIESALDGLLSRVHPVRPFIFAGCLSTALGSAVRFSHPRRRRDGPPHGQDRSASRIGATIRKTQSQQAPFSSLRRNKIPDNHANR